MPLLLVLDDVAHRLQPLGEPRERDVEGTGHLLCEGRRELASHGLEVAPAEGDGLVQDPFAGRRHVSRVVQAQQATRVAAQTCSETARVISEPVEHICRGRERAS